MVRNLYRVYLYAVSIALLIFIAVAIGGLLSTLLLLTPLRGPYETAPSQAQVVQSITFAGIAVVIAGALVVLHYWPIRRDRRGDPTAGTSAIRAFFLNITEAIGIYVGVPATGFGVLLPLAYPGADVIPAASFALPTLALVALLEAERRQTQVSSRAALAFQRLHLYSVQIMLLIFLSIAWYSAIRPIVDGLFGGVGLHQACSANESCPNYNLFWLAMSALWFVAVWLGYGWLVRNDKSSLLRFILHGIQFAYGVGFVLFGLYTAIELLLFPLFHVAFSAKDVLGPFPRYDIVSPLTLGLLVVITYNWWLRMASKQGLIKHTTLLLTENAIVAVLAAGVFWWGLGNLFYSALQAWVPVPNAPDQQSWASALAFMIAGVGYFALDFSLRRRNRQDSSLTTGPRRGFVFALLGAGILALAIGGATALYSWVTVLFGFPITNWEQMAHVGLAAFAVGVIVVVLYLWAALREQLFSGLGKKPTPVLPVPQIEPTPSPTIEGLLDDLQAGRISRDEAAMQIRALCGVSG